VPKDYLLDATDWHRQPAAFAPGKATPYFGYGYQFRLYPGEKRRFAEADIVRVPPHLGFGSEAGIKHPIR